MPHPHLERRYLIVPGLRSSRIYVLDTKPDPRCPRLVKTIEPETLHQKTGYTRPHTVHCGPDDLYMGALGTPDGGGPGGVFLLDHTSFDVKGPWEADRGRSSLPMTSGGIWAMTPCSPVSGERPVWLRMESTRNCS